MTVYPRVGGGTPVRSIPAWAGELRLLPPVYPRVGGGTANDAPVAGSDEGLSPRGRGNLLSRSAFITIGHVGGLSPRGRGNQRDRAHRVYHVGALVGGLSPRGRGNLGGKVYPRVGGGTGGVRNRVYPRVGGGNLGCGGLSDHIAGLSPRGRGNPGIPK